MGNEIVDHSNVVGASPVGAAPTTSSILDLTPGFKILHKDNCKMRWETFKFWDLVCIILEIWWYADIPSIVPGINDSHTSASDVDCLQKWHNFALAGLLSFWYYLVYYSWCKIRGTLVSCSLYGIWCIFVYFSWYCMVCTLECCSWYQMWYWYCICCTLVYCSQYYMWCILVGIVCGILWYIVKLVRGYNGFTLTVCSSVHLSVDGMISVS